MMMVVVVVTHQHQHYGVVFVIRAQFCLLTSVRTVNLVPLGRSCAFNLLYMGFFSPSFLLLWKSKLQKLFFSSLDLEGYKFRGFLNDP